jgi:hypothetical protein
MIERFKQFLKGEIKWRGITEYQVEADKPRLSEQTKSNLLKVHIHNTGTK